MHLQLVTALRRGDTVVAAPASAMMSDGKLFGEKAEHDAGKPIFLETLLFAPTISKFLLSCVS
jgi:hypothetical protein